MGYNKGHIEFTTLDLQEGFHNVPGYPPGFSERILAGSLDERNKVGNRTRILRIEPGAFSTVP
ncbi:MAG: cupin, partial [Bradyrhizobium sp.]